MQQQEYFLEHVKYHIAFHRRSQIAYTTQSGTDLGMIDGCLRAAGWTHHEPKTINEFSRLTYGDARAILFQSCLVIVLGAELVNGAWPPAEWSVPW